MLVATSAWLAEVGVGNLTYITDLGKKAAEVVEPLVTVAIDAGMTMSGLVTQVPLTLQDLSETVGAAVNQMIQYVLDLGNYLGNSVKNVNSLANAESNHVGLGRNGNWPTIKA
jgi:DeoR/GlpR family transcriptional regulator of sugar metabolism